MCNFHWNVVRYVAICITTLYFLCNRIGKKVFVSGYFFFLGGGGIFEWTLKWWIKVLNALELITGCTRNSQKKLLNITSSGHMPQISTTEFLLRKRIILIPNLILETFKQIKKSNYKTYRAEYKIYTCTGDAIISWIFYNRIQCKREGSIYAVCVNILERYPFDEFPLSFIKFILVNDSGKNVFKGILVNGVLFFLWLLALRH